MDINQYPNVFPKFNKPPSIVIPVKKLCLLQQFYFLGIVCNVSYFLHYKSIIYTSG